MRVDVITLFPDYLRPLELSLPGRARESGLLEVHVHDLRDWTHDRHRTVDHPPYGGGAGMVLKPEPWGEALDALDAAGSTLVVPTPAGERFTQAVAVDLATRQRLVFACGRYEGIDQRVLDDAADRMEVRELSLGDYVLNGGEAATLAMVEAVVRLLPGFLGNAESLVEESHGSEGLLEHPVYTKPAVWRGRAVPEVLLSGDHARIVAWRRDQALARTTQRRPDLLAAHVVEDVEITTARPADLGEIFTLQRACWVQEQHANPGVEVPALYETLDGVRGWLAEDTVLVARAAGRLVGAVRGRVHRDHWYVGRLMVAPDRQGQGLGRVLLERIEALAPAGLSGFELVTGAGSTRNLLMYRRAGYRVREEIEPGVVRLTRPISGR